MTPAHPAAFRMGHLLFQSDPSSSRTVISHRKRKGERVGDGHDGQGENEENQPKPKLAHKLRVYKIVVSELPSVRDKNCQTRNLLQ